MPQKRKQADVVLHYLFSDQQGLADRRFFLYDYIPIVTCSFMSRWGVFVCIPIYSISSLFRYWKQFVLHFSWGLGWLSLNRCISVVIYYIDQFGTFWFCKIQRLWFSLLCNCMIFFWHSLKKRKERSWYCLYSSR